MIEHITRRSLYEDCYAPIRPHIPIDSTCDIHDTNIITSNAKVLSTIWDQELMQWHYNMLTPDGTTILARVTSKYIKNLQLPKPSPMGNNLDTTLLLNLRTIQYQTSR